MLKAVTAFVTKDCNLNCEYCISGKSRPDVKTVLDIDQLLKWCAEFTPYCDLHITGGEPLMRNDIADILKKCLDAGHRTSLFTNGILINSRPEILELPIAYHVTHHFDSGVSYDSFFESIKNVPKDRIVVARVYAGKEPLNNKTGVEKIYQERGYDVQWISKFGTYHSKPYVGGKQPQQILLIGQYGEVFPCSTIKHGQLGSIYEMTFDGWPEHGCYCGKAPNNCQALLSAAKMEEIHGKIIHRK